MPQRSATMGRGAGGPESAHRHLGIVWALNRHGRSALDLFALDSCRSPAPLVLPVRRIPIADRFELTPYRANGQNDVTVPNQ